jgi:hypothetical protein
MRIGHLPAARITVRMTAGIAAGALAVLVTGLSGAAHAAHAAPTRPAAALPQTFRVQSCSGNSFCLATGSKPGPKFVALNEVWNGKTWRILPTPVNYGDQITCVNATFCLAATYTGKGHVGGEYEWNGRTWRLFKPQPPNEGITCLSAKFCVGMNNDQDGEVYWTGGATWQNMPGTDIGCGGAWCGISWFSCSSTTICEDEGSYCGDDDCDDGTFDYTDFWNGVTWSSPDFPGPAFDGQRACAGRAFCMVLNPPSAAAITNNWGQSWQSASVNLTTACHHLTSCVNPTKLACSSAHFCLAFLANNPAGALVWNGAKWGATKLPVVAGRLPTLTDLFCGSSTNCVATGTYQVNPRSGPKPVADHWNGKAWTVTSIAKVRAGYRLGAAGIPGRTPWR